MRSSNHDAVGETRARRLGTIQIAALLAKEHIEQGKTYLAGIAGKPGPQQILAAQLCVRRTIRRTAALRTTFGDAARAPVERLLAADGLGSRGTEKMPECWPKH